MMNSERPSLTCLPALLAPALALLLSGTAFGFTYNYSPEETSCTDDPVQQEPVAKTDSHSEAVPSIGTYIKGSVPDVINGTERIFSQDNVSLTLIGLGLTGLALEVDHRVKNYFQDRNPMLHVEKYGDKIGSGYPEVGIALAFFGAGELTDNRKMADTGVVAFEAYLIDGIATEGLKYSVGRRRPNNVDTMSFPSGHASMTATMAASISEMYDWDLRVAVPLYLTTAFVSASRLQANEHYLSDVIAGMTLGTVVGSSFAKYNKEQAANGGSRHIALMPLMDRDMKGAVLSLQF